MQERDRSPWRLVWVACAASLISLILAFAAFFFVGQRMARSVKAQMADPALRRTKAGAVLHAEAFPGGYRATLGLSVPMFGRVAVLEQGSPDRGLFLYLESRGAQARAEPHGERFRRLLDVRGLRLDSGEPVAAGDLVIGAQALSFRTSRGRLHEPPEGEWDALVALVDIECRPSQKIARFGVWIEADPAPDHPVDALDLSGTPADPEAIRTFLSGFRFCNY